MKRKIKMRNTVFGCQLGEKVGGKLKSFLSMCCLVCEEKIVMEVLEKVERKI